MNFECNPMKIAVDEAKNGVELRHGGPFGAVIIKNNIVIGRGHNCVVFRNDPTAHAEIEAIRNACNNTKSFNLSGSILYTTCYPCPMCLGAILWARIDKVYYCLNSKDVAKIGFDDDSFYQMFNNLKHLESMIINNSAERDSCVKLLDYYNKTNPINY